MMNDESGSLSFRIHHSAFSLQFQTRGQPAHDAAVVRPPYVPVERHVLASRVNVAEQALGFAVQKDTLRAGRGEQTIQSARALARDVRDITPVARPLFHAQLTAVLDDLHRLAAVP